MGDRHVKLSESEGLFVSDAMISRPKALPASATVADARAAFENPKTRLLLVADGGRYVGHVARDDLPATADADDPLRPLVRDECGTIAPDAPLAAAVPLVEERFQDRLVVLGPERELAGLLCLSRRAGELCADARG